MASGREPTDESRAPRSTLRRWLVAGIGLAVVLAIGITFAILGVTGEDDEVPEAVPDRLEGGTLRIALAGVSSLDPAEARDPAAVMVADHLFETLVNYDPTTSEPVPGLAEDWEVSFDQQRFVFTLRGGAHFHDGTPVTTEDVRATLERIAAPGSDSDFRFLLETVVGYADFHRDERVDGLPGVEVIDDRRIAVELSQPFAQFPLVLGNPGLAIVPAARAADPGFGEAPVGSGPLRFVERDGDVVLLERNPDHEPPTRVDAVELQLVDNAESGYRALQDGDVHLAPVPADLVASAAARYGDAGFGPFLAVTMFGFNLEHEKFSDVRFRRAIVAAANREAIIDVAYGGSVLLAEGIIPRGVPGAIDDACGDRCIHDLNRARRLVGEAFPDGNVPTVAIDFDDDERQRRVAAALQANLEATGIPARLQPHEFADYGPFIASGAQELFRFGWIGSFPSGDDFLYQLFVSGQRDNLVRMTNEQVDLLLEQARRTQSPASRRELYREAEQLILDQFPVIPIAQFTNRWAVSDDVAGFSMTPLGTFDITEVSLVHPGGGSA